MISLVLFTHTAYLSLCLLIHFFVGSPQYVVGLLSRRLVSTQNVQLLSVSLYGCLA